MTRITGCTCLQCIAFFVIWVSIPVVGFLGMVALLVALVVKPC